MLSRSSDSGRATNPLELKLAAYAVAGGAILALADNGQAASIVYSGPQSIPIGPGASVNLDLNNDGTVDYTFSNGQNPPAMMSGVGTSFLTLNSTANLVAAATSMFGTFPSALGAGVDVASQTMIATASANKMLETIYNNTPSSMPTETFGNWYAASNKYLGLEFQIGTQEFFGWAELNVASDSSATGTLEGWAYNSTPGASLLTGQTTLNSVPAPQSLIMLATGATAIAAFRAWRRRRPAQTAAPSA